MALMLESPPRFKRTPKPILGVQVRSLRGYPVARRAGPSSASGSGLRPLCPERVAPQGPPPGVPSGRECPFRTPIASEGLGSASQPRAPPGGKAGFGVWAPIGWPGGGTSGDARGRGEIARREPKESKGKEWRCTMERGCSVQDREEGEGRGSGRGGRERRVGRAGFFLDHRVPLSTHSSPLGGPSLGAAGSIGGKGLQPPFSRP